MQRGDLCSIVNMQINKLATRFEIHWYENAMWKKNVKLFLYLFQLVIDPLIECFMLSAL